VQQVSGARPPRLTCPMWAARLAAPLAEAFADATGQEARFTRASLHIIRHHRWITSRKAEEELGYRTRPLEETIADTLAWHGAPRP
jgi:dihydroflavonol-4-reductase